jgi:hypothetical protein
MTIIIISLLVIAISVVIIIGFIKSIYDDMDNNDF